MATAMARAFKKAGVKHEETPQEAAERIWEEANHDPLATMKMFDEWARQSAERMMLILGRMRWEDSVRHFLQDYRSQSRAHWKFAATFAKKIIRWEKDRQADEASERRRKAGRPVRFTGTYITDKTREYKRRKAAGIKLVKAEVDIASGRVMDLIDKEYGPFAHIRIKVGKSQFLIAEVTTQQALEHCDNMKSEAKLIRALCGLIPDPRKPIGDQWTADMIREAEAIANRRAT